MRSSFIVKLTVGGLLLIAALGVLRFKPWQRGEATSNVVREAGARQALNVGFLPVT